MPEITFTHKIIKSIFILQLSIISVVATAQDSVAYVSDLKEVVVTGYTGKTNLRDFTSSVLVLDEKQLQSVDVTSLPRLSGQQPGVVFEERANGSYRISIRGSTLRSPFGVRNVKVYWDGTPFTDPFGVTALNLIDPSLWKGVEVIKGPSSSAFGGGLGGVVQLNTRSFVSGTSALAEAGSFGRMRYLVEHQAIQDSWKHQTAASYYQKEGVRDHSAIQRFNVLHNSEFTSDKATLGIRAFAAHLDYELPGGLTADQFRQDPTQARQGNAFALGSVASDASINTQFLDFSGRFTYNVSERVNFSSSLYHRSTINENPFNLDYKKRSYAEAGTRSFFAIKLDGIQVETGIEAQFGQLIEQNFGNNMGQPDTLNFSDDIRGWTGMMFANGFWDISQQLRISAGISSSDIRYFNNRLVNNISDDTGRENFRFTGIVNPRFGFRYTPMANIHIYGSYANGFSAPTIAEVRTNDGAINRELEEERGNNLEMGVRYFTDRLTVQLTAFRYRLNNGITSYENNDRELFRNTGEQENLGVETMLIYEIFRNDRWKMEWQQSNWWYDFTFLSYESGNTVYDGNDVTGVSPFYNFSQLSVDKQNVVNVRLSWLYYSRAPLDDANTEYSIPVNDVSLKISVPISAGELKLQPYVGINNLLNRSYSFGYDLNAPGNRFFQPAEPRNIYAGVSLNF